MTIKANEQLFKEWQLLGQWVSLLASIVEKDMEVEPSDLKKWLDEIAKVCEELVDLRSRVIDHLMGTCPGADSMFDPPGRTALEWDR